MAGEEEGKKELTATQQPAVAETEKKNLENQSELQANPAAAVLSAGMAGGNSNISEIPRYNATPRQTVAPIEIKSDARIVFGIDRPSAISSGHGSDSNAAAIDIVVGMQGTRQTDKKVDPDFTRDSARIYISQKTDVDTNFKLKVVPGVIPLSVGRSAIALKADGIRLIAREGIKIVTGVDKRNSQDGEVMSINGVEIIAGNTTEGLEAIPKGDCLKVSLESLSHRIEELNGIVGSLLQNQQQFNDAITHHFHYDTMFGNVTTVADAVVTKGIKTGIDMLQETKRSLLNNKSNLAAWRQNNLCESGGNFINSRWNKVN